jgi:hypothetical protein
VYRFLSGRIGNGRMRYGGGVCRILPFNGTFCAVRGRGCFECVYIYILVRDDALRISGMC